MAIGLLFWPAPAGYRERPPLDSLVSAIERDDGPEQAQGRLEFVAALRQQLDRIERVRSRLEDRGVGADPQHAVLERLADHLHDEVHELRVEPPPRWRLERASLLERAERLEDRVLELYDAA